MNYYIVRNPTLSVTLKKKQFVLELNSSESAKEKFEQAILSQIEDELEKYLCCMKPLDSNISVDFSFDSIEVLE